MNLDETIQHCKEVAEENQRVVDTGIVFDDVTIDMLYCDDTEVIEEHLANYQKCAEEHRQLAEWLKELKYYKENTCGDAISRNDVIDTLNNMHRYIADELTLCSTGKKFEGTEVFIVDDVYEEIAENLPSVNSQSIKCGDAISRQAVIDRINKQREGLEPEIYPQDKIGDRAYRVCIEFINRMSSVIPQPRPGRWIQKEEEGEAEPFIIWECSECNETQRRRTKYCPNCGTKMEIKE